MHSVPKAIEVTARALVVDQNRLLLVSNDGDYWYAPGGRLEPGETLLECTAREVAEETGLSVKATDLLHVAEFVELARARHKVECYFLATLQDGELRSDWVDLGGPVGFREFMTRDEIQRRGNVYPGFLGEGTWLDRKAPRSYMGFERR